MEIMQIVHLLSNVKRFILMVDAHSHYVRNPQVTKRFEKNISGYFG
jgi:hypothetical protein